MVSFFAGVKFFRFWPKTMDYSPWFDFLEAQKKFGEKYATLKGMKREI